MLFITYLFVLCKSDFRLFLGPFLLTMFCHMNLVAYFIEAVYLLSAENKTVGRLDFFDEPIHLKFLTRGKIEISAGCISFPFAWQICGSEKT